MKENANLNINTNASECKDNNLHSLMGFSMPTLQSFQEIRVQSSTGFEKIKTESPAFNENKSFYSTKTGLP